MYHGVACELYTQREIVLPASSLGKAHLRWYEIGLTSHPIPEKLYRAAMLAGFAFPSAATWRRYQESVSGKSFTTIDFGAIMEV